MLQKVPDIVTVTAVSPSACWVERRTVKPKPKPKPNTYEYSTSGVFALLHPFLC